MIKIFSYIYFINIIFLAVCSAQQLRFTQIRIGLDPIYSATMLVPKLDTRNIQADYHNWESSIELVGPYRLSFVGEFGQTNLAMNVLDGTQLFKTKGTYGRIGCNFDMSPANKTSEFDLGWRLGLSETVENASYYFHGKYWDTDVTIDLPYTRYGSYIWGEIIAEYKFQLFKKKLNFMKNFWFATSIRIKLNPRKVEEIPFKTQYIPGYGFSGPISPGFGFNLIYIFHFSRGQIHKSHHLHDNYDIIEDKDHHIKKIKRHHEGADEIDRD